MEAKTGTPGVKPVPDESQKPGSDLEQLRLGDDLALNRIMARWQRPLSAFAIRYVQSGADAEDLVIETFVRLFQNRSRLRSGTNLSAWLFTVLSRLCLNHLRWRKRHPSLGADERGEDTGASGLAHPWHPESVHPAASLEQAERLHALRQAIDRLPHEQKTALLLHHYERTPLRDIGAILGRSEKSVESLLYRVRLQLRSELGPWLPDPNTGYTAAPKTG